MQELYDQLCAKHEILLPIHKIDGIAVNARFYTSLLHDTHRISISYNEEIEYIDEFSTFEGFCKVVQGMQYLKFDRMSNEFINPHQLINTNREPKWKFLPMFHHANIVMEYDECCVCYEYTIRKTVCNHTLCTYCVQRIKSLRCPACRQNMYPQVNELN